MGASANPGGHINVSNGGGPEKVNGDGGVLAPKSAVEPTKVGLRHNPGISFDWTSEEQSTLEELLTKYASDTVVVRYSKISQELRDKTVRDVVLRCKWMNEKVADPLQKSSQGANRTNGPTYAQPMISMNNDDGIPFNAIGGAVGQLLEHNSQALDEIVANFSACKIQENIALFCRTRDNIISVLNDLSDMPESMKQMPPLPVKLNEQLANSFLPRTPLPNKKS